MKKMFAKYFALQSDAVVWL